MADSADPLAEAWQRCREARPDIAVSLERFREYLDARRPEDVSREAQLTWCLDDLYLACACVAGDAPRCWPPNAARPGDRSGAVDVGSRRRR
jgi:hypothetical protein